MKIERTSQILTRYGELVAASDKLGPVDRRNFLLRLSLATFGTETTINLKNPAEILARISQIDDLFPWANQHLSSVDSSLVGRDLFPHPTKEPLIRIINYHPDGLEKDAYLKGVQEAIQRNDTVTLVVEQPPSGNEISIYEWNDYIRRVAKLYNVQGKSANFIIGNELNLGKHSSGNFAENYPEFFTVAAVSIKKISPQAKVYLYGEATYANPGIYLKDQLEKLKVIYFLYRQRGQKLFDGLALHVYKNHQGLISDVDFYRQLLDKNNFPDIQILVSEMGHPEEGRIFSQMTEREKAANLVQNLAVAACLAQSRKIEAAYWFAAASFTDQQHCLYQILPAEPGKKVEVIPTSRVLPFILTTRLLYQGVRLETQNQGIIKVSGLTQERYWLIKSIFFWKEGKRTQVVWNNSAEEISFTPSSRFEAYDIYGNKIPAINLPPVNSASGISEPIFLVEN